MAGSNRERVKIALRMLGEGKFYVIPHAVQWIFNKRGRRFSAEIRSDFKLMQTATMKYLRENAGFESRSQWGQDAFVYMFLGGKKDGFFVDIGAYDGESGSNTYALENVGWGG
jgi:hypothetical protein